jgi:hypothetical protein
MAHGSGYSLRAQSQPDHLFERRVRSKDLGPGWLSRTLSEYAPGLRTCCARSTTGSWASNSRCLSALMCPNRARTTSIASVPLLPSALLFRNRCIFVCGQSFESSVTLAEIRFGIELLADAGRRSELNTWLTHKVRPMFEQRVLQVTEDVMFKWRLLVEEGRRDGRSDTRSHSPTSSSQRPRIMVELAIQAGVRFMELA